MIYSCKYGRIDCVATGKRIENRIKEKEFTIRFVCNCLGVSNQCVYKWVHGQTLPSLENLFQLSILLETSMDNLVVGDDYANYILPEMYVREDVVITLEAR